MCTLLYVPLGNGRYRAAIGLNRDEAYGRASAGPRWWPAEGGGAGFTAPVDLVAGGTWFGVNERAVFVALTNGRQPGAFRHERSRGELVGAALRHSGLEDAVEALLSREALAYAPCHLLLAQNGRVAYVAPAEAGSYTVRWLADAPHTLTNEGLDLGDTPALPQLTGREPDARVVVSLRDVLATHDGPHPRCRHGETRGTVSSAVLLLGETLRDSRLLFAEGSPCVTAYSDVTLGAG